MIAAQPKFLSFFASSDYRRWLMGLNRGIEKESLRVTPKGSLAESSHPRSLGSTLTHPLITTDFSESLLEFITPTVTSIDSVITSLNDIHHFVYTTLHDELLWNASMPCKINSEASIRIAEYGSSNLGRLKHIYREGLTHRYGKIMQAIAGIHYNFSLPDAFWPAYRDFQMAKTQSIQDFRSASYLALLRNFRRHVWLLMYLFGASPAVDRSFLKSKPDYLQVLDADTYYAPYATSLRMSDLGYHNNAQSGLKICYNTLDEYLTSLRHAINTPYAPYEKIGILRDGNYLQLNTNILQIENEYYSAIRPKRKVTNNHQRPIQALQVGGVEYVEIRCLDINPQFLVGIDADEIRMVDMFLLYCLFSESPPIDWNECKILSKNFSAVVTRGRDPQLKLSTLHEFKSIFELAKPMFDALHPIAELLDQVHQTFAYQQTLKTQFEKISCPDLTPSAQQIYTLKKYRMSYADYILDQSKKIQQDFLARPMNANRLTEFQQLAQASLEKQQQIEMSDKEDFAAYLKNYLKV